MYERIEREDVLAVIKRYGPLIPLEVKRKLGKGETTMIGAVLSELAHHKKVAISKVKRGGSPFYYDPQQPATLERAAQYLGEKDKATFDFLRQARVADPETLEPITRVGLDQIKDYSMSFEHQEKKYYRYYLVSEEEAINLLSGKKEPVQQEQRQEQQQKKQEATQEPTTNTQASIQTPQQEPQRAETIQQNTPLTTQQSSEQTSKQPEHIPQVTKKVVKKRTTEENNNQQTLNNSLDDEFFDTIKKYCKEKNILVQQAELVRKNSELDLILRVPSALGRLTYYCKAKSKKKSNDGDVASALLTGQTKRLPTVYLTTGEVTKKAKEMTKKELRGVIIKEI